VHPVAAMFPMIPPKSRGYLELQEHILMFGQLDPIVLDGDVLLDGRNRLTICNEIGKEPKTVQWSTLGVKGEVHEWIFAKNATRRNLTDDQKTAVYVSYDKWLQEAAKKAREASQFKHGNDANADGLNQHTRTVTPESESPLKRDHVAKNARSTAGKVAAAVGVSRGKAAKVLSIKKAADDGDVEAKENFDAIVQGIKTLKEIAPKQPKAKRNDNLDARFSKAWETFWNKFTAEEKPEVVRLIQEQI